jgi:hypothetical protein
MGGTVKITTVEPGHRIQLPSAWAEALGLEGRVALERTPEGILVRPCPQLTWDEIFASKLPMGSQPAEPDSFEVGRDDLLF